VRERAAKVRLLLMDCDGVLTDGRLYFGEQGEALKVFNARDGEGIAWWSKKMGWPSGIISGRNSPIVDLRAGQLGMSFIRQGRKDKAAAFGEILAEAGFGAEEVCFIGDDTPDLQVFQLVGFSAAPCDAHFEVIQAADYVASAAGGRGAVREVIDLIRFAKGFPAL
jgi:3-deoxy-D-manno-octulosonate 8-phosphate phosphatase (KDO 8-P phosphatase)